MFVEFDSVYSSKPSTFKNIFIVMNTLDKTDLAILRAMQKNCRLTTKELAAKVNLSTTPVFERLRRLEREGYISRYSAVLNPEKLDLGFMVFCNVKLHTMNRERVIEFTDRIRSTEGVAECYNVGGRFDFLLKIYAPSMKRYQEFVIDTLATIDNIASIESQFVMEGIKTSGNIPI